MFTSLKIVLNNPSKIYHPGADVVGSVSVRGGFKSVSLAGLSVQLIGQIRTMQVQGPYSEIRETEVVCKEVVELVPLSSPIRSGDQKTFLFSIRIPRDAPPSIVINLHNKVTYQLKAFIPHNRSVKSTDRNIYIITTSELEKQSLVARTCQATVPITQGQFLVQYGHYSSSSSTHSLDDGIFGSSSDSIVLEVDFPSPGIYTDEKIPLQVVLRFYGRMPPLVLRSAKLIITETTKLSTLGKCNDEVRHHTLYSLKRPVEIAAEPLMDLSKMVMEEATIPNLAPDFSRETLVRSYSWSMHATLFVGNLQMTTPLDLIHLNCRNPLHIYGRRDNMDVLPAYSRCS